MVSVLKWLRAIFFSALNGIAAFVMAIILLLVVVLVVSLARGDGVPANAVLALDLRESLADSSNGEPGLLVPQPVTVMDLVLALDAARRDARIKGVTVRLGDGAVFLSQAEEIVPALTALRRAGKFVLVHASGFNSGGLGDYVAATAADAIWMPPKSHFAPAGTGLGEIFLRGLFDKIEAKPEIAKRAEYKSAADMYMEKTMTAPDREQLTRVAQSTYDSGVAAIAGARHLDVAAVHAALDASPQLSEDALAAHLIDHIGYDDDLAAEALRRAGAGAKSVKIKDYVRSRDPVLSAPIALVEAHGEIRDGTAGDSLFGGNDGIASDDLSKAIDEAVKDKAVKAIVLRVDSPGGSVSASDQILHAVKKAQAAGKKVVVSMGSVAASGGYYISLSADKIVAQPATLTGSIGVLTGKVSVDKSLGLVGVSAEEVSAGKNPLMDSALRPYTPEQWAAVNHEADVIYDDFTQKVAAGRKLPLTQVRDAARGRVWTGADAKAHGLVDELGGFWTAAGLAARLAGVNPANTNFKVYPRHSGVFGGLRASLGGAEEALATLAQVRVLLGLPGVREIVGGVAQAPRGGVELRAPHLPRP
ncbi:MAG: signal peptide peptidase SppA [Alphaproteobacteria bacterium]|nr:signal peptide peptidase SppA [Alphaproteobacteria bacterium]